MQKEPAKEPISQNFEHPHWDQLSREEKVEWLQKKIAERLASDDENDRFLEQCFEELDRLTPELSVPQSHTEAHLQKILSSAEEQPARTRAHRLFKRIATALIACAMIAVMTPPAHAFMQETIRENPDSNRITADIRLSTVDHGESLLPLEKQLENKAKKVTRNQPYRITYRSLEDFLTHEDFEIDYPGNMPDQYRIKFITVDYKNEENWTIDFRFYGQLVEDYRISRAKYQNSEYGKTEAAEFYEVNGKTVYISKENKHGGEQYYHAYYTENNIRYHICSTNRDMLNILLAQTFSPAA